MDSFYVMVLTVAVIILMIALVLLGLMISNGRSGYTYPPSSLMCPDYWEANTDAAGNVTCVVPDAGGINTGTMWTVSGNAPLNGQNGFSPSNGIPGAVGTMNFNAFSNIPGTAAVCAQRAWATQRGIIWDGVTNSNACKK